MRNMKPCKSMSIHNISPHLGLIQFFTLSEDAYEESWIAYEYRLFYFLTDSGFLEVADKKYELEKHSLILFGPGIEFNWIRGKYPIKCYEIRFDFTQNYKNLFPRVSVGRKSNHDLNKVVEKVYFEDCPLLNSTVFLKNMSFLAVFLHQIHFAFSDAGLLSHNIARSMLETVLFELTQKITTGSIVYRKKAGLFEEISAYIHANYQFPEITAKGIAELFGTSLRNANKEFLANVNLTMHQYLTTYRVQEALNFLKTTSLPVSEIARMTGFRTQGYFSRYIKNISGFTPSEYRLFSRKKNS